MRAQVMLEKSSFEIAVASEKSNLDKNYTQCTTWIARVDERGGCVDCGTVVPDNDHFGA